MVSMAAVPSGFQNAQEMNSGPLGTEELVTLSVKHLPEAFTHDTFTRLFSHYGASSVRPCSTGRCMGWDADSYATAVNKTILLLQKC